mgnify:CR=1 FL=1
MDSSSIAMIASLVVLTALSAYFSATETAFSSLNRIRLKNMANLGNQKAALTLSLSENYDKLLSTILIGNNIVNITSASLATVIFVQYFGDVGVTLSTVVMTVVVLIFGEISPKSLAKENPESFAMFSAPVMRVLIWLLTPLNFLFAQWKKLLGKLFRAKTDPGITEEELMTIVDEAEDQGGIGQYESELIRSAIEFNNLEADDILTPRVNIVAVEDDESKEEIAEKFANCGFSRLLVYRDSIDHVVGVLHEKDFYSALHAGEFHMNKTMRNAIYVIGSIKISDLMRQLQRSKTHVAVVVDEFGGTQGIVTMEDILEELVGEIWDEHDKVVENMQPIADGVYLVAGGANLEKTLEVLDVDREYDSFTVSGWVIEEMGKIPHAGEAFDVENLHVTVTKADGRRVIEVKVEVRQAQKEETRK